MNGIVYYVYIDLCPEYNSLQSQRHFLITNTRHSLSEQEIEKQDNTQVLCQAVNIIQMIY